MPAETAAGYLLSNSKSPLPYLAALISFKRFSQSQVLFSVYSVFYTFERTRIKLLGGALVIWVSDMIKKRKIVFS